MQQGSRSIKAGTLAFCSWLRGHSVHGFLPPPLSQEYKIYGTYNLCIQTHVMRRAQAQWLLLAGAGQLAFFTHSAKELGRACLSIMDLSIVVHLTQLTARSGRGRACSSARSVVFLLNPDFYETQPQKPHNKLKKSQMTLREKRLRPELKLGGESDNPTSKGIP